MKTKATSPTRAEVVAARIRQARDEAGLSNRGLARAAGVERRAVIRWTNGQNVPELSSLEKIARATGKPLDFFRADDDEEDRPSVNLADALRTEMRKIIREELAEEHPSVPPDS